MMMEKSNISHIHDCYGCGICAVSCPKDVIEIILNKDGFYEANVKEENDCIHCGICINVCAFNYNELSLKESHPLKSWGAWSNDEQIRRKCSSGGIGFEIGKQLIAQGYKAVGCLYNIKEQRAEHFIANTIEEFIPSIGSKYIQSYTVDAFKQIVRKGQKYLVTGTPCQIDSFRRMIQEFHCEENFVLMDFYCHCVPTMHAWKAYINMLEPIVGKVVYASWRNKFSYGWHDSWLMCLDGEKTGQPIDWNDDYNMLLREKQGFIQSRLSKGDIFYRLFLGDVCQGPQCQKQCKYKYDRSSADIRIGDFWGETYKHDEKGVSALVAFTNKGVSIIEGLKGVSLQPHPFEVVAEGQMKKNAVRRECYPLFMYLLKHKVPLNSCFYKFAFFIQNVINKTKSIL